MGIVIISIPTLYEHSNTLRIIFYWSLPLPDFMAEETPSTESSTSFCSSHMNLNTIHEGTEVPKV